MWFLFSLLVQVGSGLNGSEDLIKTGEAKSKKEQMALYWQDVVDGLVYEECLLWLPGEEKMFCL